MHLGFKAELEAMLEAYFADEKHLHSLREKLFSLDAYCLRSVAEQDVERAKKAAAILLEQDKERHKEEIASLKAKHAAELLQLEEILTATLEKEREDFRRYREETDGRLQEATRHMTELAHYRDAYKDLDDAYRRFCSLSDNRRFSLGGFFGEGKSAQDFLSGLLQQSHLEDFWEYIARLLVGGNTPKEEAETLIYLFDFAFDMVNRSERLPLYVRVSPEVGDDFDRDNMDCLPGSPRLGSVRRVIFAGFAHRESGRTVKRSLVELG